jgi:hypothetical protein
MIYIFLFTNFSDPDNFKLNGFIYPYHASILKIDFTKTFEGTINNKFSIKMTLTKKATRLSGTYCYKSKGKPLKLDGTIDKSGILKLKEFDNTGNMTGIFEGQLQGEKITGYWKKPDGSKKMTFSVNEIKSKKQDNDLSGSYIGDAYRDVYDDLSGQYLEIKQESPDYFFFTINVDNSGKCSGLIDGMAILNKGVWIFSEDPECVLTFKFTNNLVKIYGDDGCVGYHGVSCNFMGTYSKE